MYKIIAVALFAGSLVGCETSSQAFNMAQQGTEAFSCPEISKDQVRSQYFERGVQCCLCQINSREASAI